VKIQTIAERLLFTTVRIETSTTIGSATRTAFILSDELDDKTELFLVTNKNVVANANSGRFFFTLSDGVKPLIGQCFDIHVDNFEQRWCGHPKTDVDITVMLLVLVLQEIEKSEKRVLYKSSNEFTLKITDFRVPLTAEIAEIASKVSGTRELIDYWAIDWDYTEDTFHNQWQGLRTKKNPRIDYEAKNNYEN
jgi:hypothetical protein